MASGFPRFCDIAVIGGGAAGLAAAAWAARTVPGAAVVVADGARLLGAKILVSGGGRCNLTNREVTERDFSGGSPRLVRHVLRAFPVAATLAWFHELGVAVHEEPLGKMFPDTNRARTVLDALVGACREAGVVMAASTRVEALEQSRSAAGGCFELVTSAGRLSARRVVIATGGLALPKSGSDGTGYGFATAFGHGRVPTTPALVPLVLDGRQRSAPSGVSLPCRLRLETGSAPAAGTRRGAVTNIEGAFLWTHTGASGPAVLDVSRHWLRARLEGRPCVLTANWLGDDPPAAVERWLQALVRERPRASVHAALASRLPASMADTVAAEGGLTPLAELPRTWRQEIVRRLTAWPLDVTDSRGYTHAEVTAGGIALEEVDAATMQSRRVPGLYLVGEVLDVDGRLGGFNFQWAWSSGHVAGRAAARSLGA